ncbi:hypothetical protein CUJ83_03320 [Methanocella sp. CWC-04]|uniref:HEAT repeat-containing protein n=1 Tax=Methanooceanicella nereidis TaxID=2052831 RepID=A0AAP2RBA9_9EURY|nr:hypothetical protein [Methanocella sp. CWC-04]MCD1294024.1 hypothetical protein [Methanocella sp. CWC-04]
MSKIDTYREKLRIMSDWEPYLLSESGLPGPRGNIELAKAVAEEGDEKLFKGFLELTPDKAPVNSPYEFLAFCGVIGMGRLMSEGKVECTELLRNLASDPRWRMREGVAMALQRYGMKDMDGLLEKIKPWSTGSPLEKRAAAAALCEPVLLTDRGQVVKVLDILDSITASIENTGDRKSEDFKALRKGMAYCWSVAAVAFPEEGKKRMEKWFSADDKDIRWIMKENLKKNRLLKMDREWVDKWMAEI